MHAVSLLSAKTLNDFVAYGLKIARMLFPGEMEQLLDDVCNYCRLIHDVAFFPKDTELVTMLS